MTSNTPLPSNIVGSQLWAPVQKELTWLQKHERIMIVALVLMVGTFLGNKWLNYEGAQKDAKVEALTLVVNQDKQTVANLALQAAQAQATYQTTLDAITKENSLLAQANAQELASLAQRQVVDKTLPLPAVAQRIEVLVPGAQGGIAATTAGVVMNDTASHSVLTTLEEVPVLNDELKNETQIAQNNANLVSQGQIVNNDLTKQVGALNNELSDAGKQCKAEVAAEKVKTKKAFIKGLKYGFMAGFAAGAYILHAL
jgi:hypothetical protein